MYRFDQVNDPCEALIKSVQIRCQITETKTSFWKQAIVKSTNFWVIRQVSNGRNPTHAETCLRHAKILHTETEKNNFI